MEDQDIGDVNPTTEQTAVAVYICTSRSLVEVIHGPFRNCTSYIVITPENRPYVLSSIKVIIVVMSSGICGKMFVVGEGRERLEGYCRRKKCLK